MSENIKIEEQKLASNADAAIERAKSLSKNAKIEKKENLKKEQKQEQKQELNQMKDLIEQNDAKISKWGDMLFSKAQKELKANQMQLLNERDYFFAIDAEKKQISFRLKQESDKIDEKSYLCFYRARISSFYHKKAARDKLEAAFAKKLEDMRFKIQFSKDESKNFIQILA